MREIRISDDGDSVAIRTDFPEGGQLAYGVFSAVNGGHWAAADEVKDWFTPQFTPKPAVKAASSS